jgi:hypothetical protein
VTTGSPDDRWEGWFADPPRDDPDTERFKWGWNEADGEIVWPVGGPGDGRPGHVEQLVAAWGRAPSSNAGDVMGVADDVPARGSDPPVVVIHPFYGESVPDSVVGWFRDGFPDAQVRLAGTE